MHTSVALTSAVVALLALILITLFPRRTEAREPRRIFGTIPIISNLRGLMKHKTMYFSQVSLSLPGKELYVVSSPKLALSVQKMAQDLAFPPIAAKFITAISGCSKEAQQIIQENMMGEDGNWGYSQEVYKTIRIATLPGKNLNDALRRMMQRLSLACNNLNKQSPSKVNLVKWLQHEVTMAAADAVWGPVHPLQDRKIEDAFWEFENGLYGIIFGLIPSIMANKALKARQLCEDAFLDYFMNMRHNQGSELVKVRYQTSRDHGVSLRDIAKLEVLNVLATVVNTAPAVFWAVYYVHTHPVVLREVREEVNAVMQTEPLPNGASKHVVDMIDLKSSCPILISTIQETLRHSSVGATYRYVMRDTLLADRYLLRKGSILAMPSQVYHSDVDSWGSNAGDFDHRRFITIERSKSTAFRAFGGGHTLCPGRHFATTEMLTVIAMLVVRFDMKPSHENEWPQMKAEGTKLWAQLTESKPDLDLDIQCRDCWSPDDEWDFRLSDQDAVIRMTMEDRE